MKIKDINGCTAKVQLFKMSDAWKKETLVDVAAVDDDSEISEQTEEYESKSWRKDCLIISLEIKDGPLSGKKLLLWPLSNSYADAPGVMNMYLPDRDTHVEIPPSKFEIYPPD